MSVEWDEAKRRQNLAKHGVDFIDAAKIFANPVLERIDDRADYGEQCLVAVGVHDDLYFVVIYT